MIPVRLSPTKVVSIAFTHPTYKISPHGYSETFERKSTRCYIYDGEPKGKGDTKNLKVISMAVIKQYFKDKEWSREKRRTFALGRALAESGLSREDHAKVWSAYHSRPRTKSEPPNPATPADQVIIPHPSAIKAFGQHAVVNKLILAARPSVHGPH